MATKKPSKTAKKATTASSSKRPGNMDLSPDVIRFIPTGGNVFSYVLQADGRSVHSRVGSETFYAAIATLIGTNVATRCAEHADRLESGAPGAGWSRAAAMLRGLDVTEDTSDEIAG